MKNEIVQLTGPFPSTKAQMNKIPYPIGFRYDIDLMRVWEFNDFGEIGLIKCQCGAVVSKDFKVSFIAQDQYLVSCPLCNARTFVKDQKSIQLIEKIKQQSKSEAVNFLIDEQCNNERLQVIFCLDISQASQEELDLMSLYRKVFIDDLWKFETFNVHLFLYNDALHYVNLRKQSIETFPQTDEVEKVVHSFENCAGCMEELIHFVTNCLPKIVNDLTNGPGRCYFSCLAAASQLATFFSCSAIVTICNGECDCGIDYELLKTSIKQPNPSDPDYSEKQMGYLLQFVQDPQSIADKVIKQKEYQYQTVYSFQICEGNDGFNKQLTNLCVLTGGFHKQYNVFNMGLIDDVQTLLSSLNQSCQTNQITVICPSYLIYQVDGVGYDTIDGRFCNLLIDSQYFTVRFNYSVEIDNKFQQQFIQIQHKFINSYGENRIIVTNVALKFQSDTDTLINEMDSNVVSTCLLRQISGQIVPEFKQQQDKSGMTVTILNAGILEGKFYLLCVIQAICRFAEVYKNSINNIILHDLYQLTMSPLFTRFNHQLILMTYQHIQTQDLGFALNILQQRMFILSGDYRCYEIVSCNQSVFQQDYRLHTFGDNFRDNCYMILLSQQKSSVIVIYNESKTATKSLQDDVQVEIIAEAHSLNPHQSPRFSLKSIKNSSQVRLSPTISSRFSQKQVLIKSTKSAKRPITFVDSPFANIKHCGIQNEENSDQFQLIKDPSEEERSKSHKTPQKKVDIDRLLKEPMFREILVYFHKNYNLNVDFCGYYLLNTISDKQMVDDMFSGYSYELWLQCVLDNEEDLF